MAARADTSGTELTAALRMLFTAVALKPIPEHLRRLVEQLEEAAPASHGEVGRREARESSSAFPPSRRYRRP
jgi:hypothetical protein